MGREVKRLFLAIMPDDAHYESLKNFVEFNKKMEVKWVSDKNFHVTCLFIGDIQTGKILDLKDDISEVVAGMSSFKLKADRFMFMPPVKPRMICLRFDRNKDFTRLNLLLSKTVLRKDPVSPARAHITLARFKRSPKNHILFSKLPNVELEVNKIILFESKLTPKGAAYYPLYTWRLD